MFSFCALVTWNTLQALVTTKSKALPGIETRRLGCWRGALQALQVESG